MIIKRLLNRQKAIGLVEAVVAIGIISTAMIIITQVALKTIKRARKVELEDVAIQAAVEALDYLKIPSELEVDFGSVCNFDSIKGYAKLFPIAGYGGMYTIVGTSVYGDGSNEINETNHPSTYLNQSLSEEGYEVYQQIFLESAGKKRYIIKSIVVWRSVDGEYYKKVLAGYRYGGFEKSSSSTGICPVI